MLGSTTSQPPRSHNMAPVSGRQTKAINSPQRLLGAAGRSDAAHGPHFARSLPLLALAVLVLAGIPLCSTGCAATRARTADPDRNGKIAFVRSGRLWMVGAGGNAVARLAGVSSGAANPAWSPDGSRIAYDRGGDIYVANADGTGVVDVSAASLHDRPADIGPPASCDMDPAWSPDGKLIAFTAIVDSCTGAAGGLYAMTPSGQGWRVIEEDYEGLQGGDGQPAWGPEGRGIAFTRSDTDLMSGGPYFYDIELLDAATGKGVRALTKNGHSQAPTWSPDGKRIAFVERGRIAVMNVAGKRKRTLVSGNSPAWSPDGRLIVFVDRSGLEVIGANGKGERLLLACRCASPDWKPLR